MLSSKHHPELQSGSDVDANAADFFLRNTISLNRVKKTDMQTHTILIGNFQVNLR